MKEKEERKSEDYLRGLIKEITLDLTERNLARVIGYSLNLRASQRSGGKGVKLKDKQGARTFLEE
jgi:hypothetical protein